MLCTMTPRCSRRAKRADTLNPDHFQHQHSHRDQSTRAERSCPSQAFFHHRRHIRGTEAQQRHKIPQKNWEARQNFALPFLGTDTAPQPEENPLWWETWQRDSVKHRSNTGTRLTLWAPDSAMMETIKNNATLRSLELAYGALQGKLLTRWLGTASRWSAMHLALDTAVFRAWRFPFKLRNSRSSLLATC